MKKILFVNASLTGGGSERVMASLANKASESNQVTMVLIRNKERTYTIDEKINVIQLGNNCPKLLLFFKRIKDLREVIKNVKPDTMISFMEDISFFAITASLGISVKRILSIRNDPNRKDKRHFYWLSRLYNNRIADYTVFQTEQARECYPIRIQRKSVVIPNPISEMLPDEYYGVRTQKIVAVGRLVPQKRFEMLIEVFSTFLETNKDYTLDIFGEGPERGKLENLVSSLDVRNKVTFKGFASNVLDQIKDAMMYISCSDFEGISNTMLEALALGIPTICTDCPIGGAAMVIKDGYNGVLIPVNDKKALYDAMIRIKQSEEFRNKISENAINVRTDYSLDRIWNEWSKII